jgi:hypothetical protein
VDERSKKTSKIRGEKLKKRNQMVGKEKENKKKGFH